MKTKKRGAAIHNSSLTIHHSTAGTINLKRFIADYTTSSGKPMPEEKLLNLGLFVLERETLFPTHAALLLSESPYRKRFFPYAKIECSASREQKQRFFWIRPRLMNPFTPPLSHAWLSLRETSRWDRGLVKYTGKTVGNTRWKLFGRQSSIPSIHRDYAIQGSDIKVAIFRRDA